MRRAKMTVCSCLLLMGMAAAVAQSAGQGRGGAAQSPLGSVNALGQELKRPPAPTGLIPRLPAGRDLSTSAMASGMAAGPEATSPPDCRAANRFLYCRGRKSSVNAAANTEEEDPTNFCLPAGVPRVTPYPSRFVQNYTIKPTHMFILHEGTIHTYRQIFMDGRKHPRSSSRRGWDTRQVRGRRTRWSSTPSAITTSPGSTIREPRIRSGSTRLSGGRGSTRAT